MKKAISYHIFESSPQNENIALFGFLKYCDLKI